MLLRFRISHRFFLGVLSTPPVFIVFISPELIDFNPIETWLIKISRVSPIYEPIKAVQDWGQPSPVTG